MTVKKEERALGVDWEVTAAKPLIYKEGASPFFEYEVHLHTIGGYFWHGPHTNRAHIMT
jgi:hypothetical protein